MAKTILARNMTFDRIQVGGIA